MVSDRTLAAVRCHEFWHETSAALFSLSVLGDLLAPCRPRSSPPSSPASIRRRSTSPSGRRTICSATSTAAGSTKTEIPADRPLRHVRPARRQGRSGSLRAHRGARRRREQEARQHRRSRSATSTRASSTRRRSTRSAPTPLKPRLAEIDAITDTRRAGDAARQAVDDRPAGPGRRLHRGRRRRSDAGRALPRPGRHGAARSRLLPEGRREVRRTSARSTSSTSTKIFTLAGRPTRGAKTRRPCWRSKPSWRRSSGRRSRAATR